MYRNTLRNSIVTSMVTLPVMAVLTFLFWMVPDLSNVAMWGGLAATAVAAYAIMELNNRFALLGMRSRMMSSAFLFIMLGCPALRLWNMAAIVPVCLVGCLGMLFCSHQQTRPEGYIYHAFLAIAVAAVFYAPALLFVIPAVVCMSSSLHSLTLKSLLAALFGLATPLWILYAWAIWTNTTDTFLSDFFTPFIPKNIDEYVGFWKNMTLSQIVTLSTLTFYSLLGVMNLMRRSFMEKIRTRALLYVIVVFHIAALILTLLLPQQADTQLRIYIVTSAMIIAHYFTQGKGRYFDQWFYFSTIVFIAAGALNWWTCK